HARPGVGNSRPRGPVSLELSSQMRCFSVIWLNLLVHILFALLPMKSYFSYYIKICDTVQQMGTKKDIHSTSTRKAFRSLSLSMLNRNETGLQTQFIST
uniref:Uncharacterized protein n=1 Tax=Maylandia zebra TaxID=106582 RepID=A0A3P9DFQ7_9CICH